jgi:hypothetical protein
MAQTKRRVFYSFHYKPDCVRAGTVRNIGFVEGNQPAKDNDWETITEGGDKAIQKWIDDQMVGRTCVAVLVGANTAGRKWINYEIETGWNSNRGVVGIHIHRLKNFEGQQSTKGSNPFDTFTMKSNKQKKLSSIVKCYDPPYSDSKQAYGYISDNIATWIEEAIQIRVNYAG